MGGVLNGEQKTIVERGIVSGDGGTRGANDLRAVGGQQSTAGEIAAVRIERDFVRALERADEISNGILREDKTPVHIIAGIKKNKNIGAFDERGELVCRHARAVVLLLIGRNIGRIAV